MRAIAARWAWPAVLATCLLAAGLLSVATGLDVNWDLKNYHYYNAYSYLTGRLGWDMAPAQIQTYHSPLLDLGFYALVQEIPSPRIIAFVMALPAGIAAFFLLRMLVALFPPAIEARALWITAAFAIGVTGSSGRGVIGSTMNEWQPAMLLIISLAVLVASIARVAIPSIASLVLAGIATGFAVGLKLTYGVFAVGLVIAVLAIGSWRQRVVNAMLIGGAIFAGFLVTYGFWGATLWKEFGNPFFPYFNQVFQSPWWDPVPWFDRNFGPHNAIDAIFFPIAFMQNNRLVGEMPFTDWRLAALLLIAMAGVLRYAYEKRRPSTSLSGLAAPPWIFLGVFTLVSYLVWLKLYAIYRYLVPLEMVSGPLIVAGTMWLVRGGAARAVAVVVIAASLVGWTQPSDWGRLPFRGPYFSVTVPDLAPHSLVIMDPGNPMAYAIAFTRPDARFVSPNNNLLHYNQDNLLTRRIAELISTHEGPLYSLDIRGPDLMGEIFEHFHLRRIASSCLTIQSYLDTDSMQVCRLARTDRQPKEKPRRPFERRG